MKKNVFNDDDDDEIIKTNLHIFFITFNQNILILIEK